MADDLHALVREARAYVGFTGPDFAKLLGVSAKTVYRHPKTAGVPLGVDHYEKIVRALYPKNAPLAARLAAAIGKTLGECGVNAAGTVGPLPPAAKVHAEALICAAADAMDKVPREARPVVAQIFAQVRAMGVDVPSLVDLLAAADKGTGGKKSSAKE